MISGSRSFISVSLSALAWRGAIFGALWLILCGGDLGSWPFGLPAVMVATWLDLQLTNSGAVRSIRPLNLARFLFFFLGKSIQGGLDVMRRVIDPRLPIDPGLVDFTLTIPHVGGRIFLANSITLLPGTLSARLQGDCLTVHTLDKGLPVLAAIKDLETRIAALYGPGSGQGEVSR